MEVPRVDYSSRKGEEKKKEINSYLHEKRSTISTLGSGMGI